MNAQADMPRPAGRSRRKWIVMFAIAIVAGAVWWLTRPSIDPRFVGTWQYEDEPRQGVKFSAEGWFVLLRDGKPLWNGKNNKWFVRRNALHKVISTGDPIQDAWMNVERRYRELIGHWTVPMTFSDEIQDVQDSTIRFVYPDGGERVLRRVVD